MYQQTWKSANKKITRKSHLRVVGGSRSDVDDLAYLLYRICGKREMNLNNALDMMNIDESVKQYILAIALGEIKIKKDMAQVYKLDDRLSSSKGR